MKTMIIGLLAILVGVSVLSGCIGDEPETIVTVRKVKIQEEDEPETGVSKSPPQSPTVALEDDLDEPTPEEEKAKTVEKLYPDILSVLF
jgi:hypothetical protein